MILLSFFHVYFIRKKDYVEKGFFYYIISAIILLIIAYPIIE